MAYIISFNHDADGKPINCFGECMEDGYYFESKRYFDVLEKMNEHEKKLCNSVN